MAVPKAVSMAIPWDSDDSRNDCTRCNAQFTFFKRRHHCRSCGHLYCGDCSKMRAPVVKWRINRRVRVCPECFDEIAAASTGGSSKSSSSPIRSGASTASRSDSGPASKASQPPPAVEVPQQQQQQAASSSPSLPASSPPLADQPSSAPTGVWVGRTTVANFAFQPQTAVELELRPGDQVSITETDSGAIWLKGTTIDGRIGWFPSSYVSLT